MRGKFFVVLESLAVFFGKPSLESYLLSMCQDRCIIFILYNARSHPQYRLSFCLYLPYLLYQNGDIFILSYHWGYPIKKETPLRPKWPDKTQYKCIMEVWYKNSTASGVSGTPRKTKLYFSPWGEVENIQKKLTVSCLTFLYQAYALIITFHYCFGNSHCKVLFTCVGEAWKLV